MLDAENRTKTKALTKGVKLFPNDEIQAENKVIERIVTEITKTTRKNHNTQFPLFVSMNKSLTKALKQTLCTRLSLS